MENNNNNGIKKNNSFDRRENLSVLRFRKIEIKGKGVINSRKIVAENRFPRFN